MIKNSLFKTLCLVIFICTTGMVSCKKDGKTDTDTLDTPSSRIPAALNKGSWFTGTLSAISYFDRDGHHLGNDYEAGREFQFFEDENGKGKIVFWQYLGLRQSPTCISELFTLKEGTVVFNGPKFTFYPTKGNFKTVKDKCSSGNGTTNRKATAEDLYPITYRWELKDVDGHQYLYTYTEDDTQHENPLFIYECTK